jgi:hypothetical protein
MRPADAAAAATEQPSSSQEQFVNTGMLDYVVVSLNSCRIYLVPASTTFKSCVQGYKPGWNAGGNGHRNPLITSAQRGRELTRRCPQLLKELNKTAAATASLPRAAYILSGVVLHGCSPLGHGSVMAVFSTCQGCLLCNQPPDAAQRFDMSVLQLFLAASGLL